MSDQPTPPAATPARPSLGAQVRARREALGLTREQLAAAAGCCLTSVSLIENDKNQNPGVKLVESLARTLGIEVKIGG